MSVCDEKARLALVLSNVRKDSFDSRDRQGIHGVSDVAYEEVEYSTSRTEANGSRVQRTKGYVCKISPLYSL